MRVTTAFNRVLSLPGASVAGVDFTDAGLVLGLRRRRRRHRCPCGWSTRARYDSSRRRWRHLDFGATAVLLEADIARINCRACGRVRTEEVPWARPSARHTRDFEDVVAWLAQRMDKTAVSVLMRCSWEAVDAIVGRVVVEHIDDTRLDDLFRIGVDEISYTRGHRYLTVVANHDSGNVVWAAKDRSKDTFTDFFTALGPQRRQQIEAITSDASGAYMQVAREQVPQARLCLDPFHIMRWANEALDTVYRDEPTPLEWTPRFDGRRTHQVPTRRTWRRVRTTLRTGHERLDEDQLFLLNDVRRHRRRLFRAWELKEELRGLYRHTSPAEAAAYLKAWITAALRSRIPAMKTLGRRLRNHFEAIVAAVELGLSNSRLEGINAKIRVIQRRGYGHPKPGSLISMIYLCLGGITITLPTER